MKILTDEEILGIARSDFRDQLVEVELLRAIEQRIIERIGEAFTYAYRYHSPYGGGETEISFTRNTAEAIETIPLYAIPFLSTESAVEAQPMEDE